MKRIISFSLWGNDPKYWYGAVDNVRLAQELYPEWICRFYIDIHSDKKLIDLITKLPCEIILKEPRQAFSGLFWRFLAADDAEIMICRDTDSRLSERERIAVEQWLDSDKQFHIMRDHPHHFVLIPGGMWGCKGMEGMEELIEGYPYQCLKGTDQLFLSQMIYPQVSEWAMIHDSYDLFGDSIPFPTERNGDEFVGRIFDQYENSV